MIFAKKNTPKLCSYVAELPVERVPPVWEFESNACSYKFGIPLTVAVK